MRTPLKIQIAIFILSLLFLFSGIGLFIFFQRDQIENFFNRILETFGNSTQTLTVKTEPEDNDNLKRIEDLENKIKDLEKEQKVSFPEEKIFSLTNEQIDSIVELWCPDDNYGYNGFVSIGSGSIIDSKGLIITNRHVISNENWSVIVSSPTCFVAVTDDISQEPKIKYTADVIAYSPEPNDNRNFDFDVAILEIYDVCRECADAPDFLPSKFSYLDIGYSDVLSPGDYIAIAGYPQIGAGTFSFTEGVVSGRVGDFVIKTDAKIDSGNSGGAALNRKYQLAGVPTWIISGQAESMGYIIGIDQIIYWYNNKVIPSGYLEISY